MRNELTAPTHETLHTNRDVPVDVAVDLGADLVNPQLGPILSCIKRTPGPSDTGNVYQYISRIQETAAFSPNGSSNPSNTGGSALESSEAKIAAIGEAIERYCLSLSDPDDFITRRYDNLNRSAISPLDINAFSDRQLKEKNISHKEIRSAEYHWTATREMISGEKVLVPGQLVYLPFSSPLVVRSPITTGAATGMDYESACYRALCEIIERECFIIGYLNKISFPRIDLSSVEDSGIKTYQAELENRGMDVYVFDISLDHPFHSCLAIAVNQNRRPMVSLGLDADVDMTKAVRDALREALQINSWDESDEIRGDEPTTIKTIEERAAFWASSGRVADLDFWLETDSTTEIGAPVCPRSEALNVAESYLDKHDYCWYVADVTTPEVKERGFKTVSTVIPAFHPMHLIESYKYLGSDRLYSVPIEVGYLQEQRAETELNTLPHPFL